MTFGQCHMGRCTDDATRLEILPAVGDDVGDPVVPVCEFHWEFLYPEETE